MTSGDTKWHYKYSRQLQGIINFYPNRDFPKVDKEGNKATEGRTGQRNISITLSSVH